MKTNFWLIRHGETDWNHEKRYQGSADQPLNALGKQQAETLIPRLEKLPYDAVYCSDLGRVRETARIALRRDDGINFDSRLRELSFGKFEGLTLAEIIAKYPGEFEEWDKDTFANAPHEGETMAQITARLKDWFEEIRTRHEGQSVLVFSHGGAFGILLCLLLESSPGRWWQYHFDNCSISHLQINSRGYVLRKLNDTSHLGNLVTDHGTVS